MPSKYLYEELKEKVFDYGILKSQIPNFIVDNLKYPLFDWQKKAIEHLLTYENIREKENITSPLHLMFNMATGTGKTLVMAALILYYYKKGYRSFIFFVNQNNIVDKTENNFIDKLHSKYLFKERIVIDNKTIEIKKVNTFSNNINNIEIKFTTIQKLYNDIHIEKENQVYLNSLVNKDIVMLADEGHHLNADTKKKQEEITDLNIELKDSSSKEEIEKKGWEHTVLELLLNKNNKGNDNKNILLEFTATIPEHLKVVEKYAPITLYKFDLKQFLSAGYTKEINLVSSTLEKKERILQALLFNWYRHKIALKHDISNFKPVILFRSKTIEQSKEDFNDFNNIIRNLKESDFKFLDLILNKVFEGTTIYEQGKSRTIDLIEFIKKEKIKKTEIVDFMKYAFDERNCIITNSKDGTKTKEKTTNEQESLLNDLENKNNHIRAIFTVDRLTEGWDVLNLFDIVRLYTTQQSGGANNNITPEGTVKEKQLIGRGVRYFPFKYKDTQNNKRRFDNDLKNELRFLEELYYYTYDEDSRYISHLKNELRKDGYINDGKIVKKFSLKQSFLNSDFYNDVKLFYNERVDNPDRKKKSLTDIRKDFVQYYKLKGLELNEQELDLSSPDDIQRLNLKEKGLKTISVKISSFERHVFQKALNIKSKSEGSLLRFELLKEELDIDSIDDLQNKFLGDFEIQLITQNIKFEEISNSEKLDMLLHFLDHFVSELKQNSNPKKGNAFKAGQFKDFFKDVKEKSVTVNENNERFYNQELKHEDWYVLNDFYGTSEEEGLIKFVQETIINLKENYSEVYLLRNEEQYKIYDFKEGRGFQPDFILFLKQSKKLYYQVFIEPKGDNLIETDKWKNDFLKQITEKYSDKNILKAENKDYILIGLPFFNESENQDFVKEYKKLINN